MSYFEGMPFFFCLIIVLLIAAAAGYMEKSLRWYTLAVSVLFLIFVFGGKTGQTIYLILFCLWSLLLVKGYEKLRARDGRKEGVYHLFVLASLIPLILCKATPLVHMDIFGFTGISYLTFRVVQIIIEMYDGVIKEIKVTEFAAFLLFSPVSARDRSTAAGVSWQIGTGRCRGKNIWSLAPKVSGSCCWVRYIKWCLLPGPIS